MTTPTGRLASRWRDGRRMGGALVVGMILLGACEHGASVRRRARAPGLERGAPHGVVLAPPPAAPVGAADASGFEEGARGETQGGALEGHASLSRRKRGQPTGLLG